MGVGLSHACQNGMDDSGMGQDQRKRVRGKRKGRKPALRIRYVSVEDAADAKTRLSRAVAILLRALGGNAK